MSSKFRSLSLILVSGSAILLPVTSPAAPRHLMMVVSKGLPGITIYDGDTEEPICRAFMGVSPHEAAFSNDGQFAYVPVYGSSSVGLAGTDEHALHFVRTSDCKDASVLDTGENKRPHGILVGKSGTIYLTAEVAQKLLLIDPDARRIVTTIPTGSPYSHMIAVTDDESKVYVSNVQSKTVSVLDVKSRRLETTVPTSVQNQRMTLSPDGKWFVTSLSSEGKIAFYRTADNQLDFTVAVPGAPFVAKFSSDGEYLYDAGMEDKTIHAWKVDVAARKVTATLDDLGSATGALAVNPFNQRVYISDATSSKISAIDPKSWTVVKILPADKTPDAILFTAVK